MEYDNNVEGCANSYEALVSSIPYFPIPRTTIRETALRMEDGQGGLPEGSIVSIYHHHQPL